MNKIYLIPLRQILFICLTLLLGIVILFIFNFNLGDKKTFNILMFIYGFGVPFILLTFPTLLDLDNKKVFFTWFLIGLISFLIYLLNINNKIFLIIRKPNMGSDYINNLLIKHSTISSLKSLLIFLIVYYILNKIINKVKGRKLLNTFAQFTWVNDEASIKICGLDVIFNFILFFSIVLSSLFY